MSRNKAVALMHEGFAKSKLKVDENYFGKGENQVYMCVTCYNKFKTKSVPAMCVANELYVDQPVEEMNLNEIEQSFISKNNYPKH